MEDESREELPDEVVVPLEEARQVLVALERHLETLRDSNDASGAAAVDLVLGRITRWIWPFLRDLDDEEDGYDGLTWIPKGPSALPERPACLG